jgi:hypothetical protein
MKKNLISIFLLLLSINCLAQNSSVKVLAGKTENEVIDYFNSIINRSSNSSLRIEKGVTKYGDLTLKLELPLSEESKFNCISLTTVFYHVSKDSEVCVTQMIFGSEQYITENLSYLKDNFKQTSSNNWEEFNIKEPFKTTAEFSKEGSSYAIVYRLEPVKKK